MRTKLIHLADMDTIMGAAELSCVPTEKSVNEAVKTELTRGRVFYVSCDNGEPVGRGDRVTLRVSSSLPKFNREEVKLSVGSGLYHSDLEEKLTGMKVGGSGEITIKGEPVAFTVLRSERRQCPELTDEMARSQGIEGVETLAQYEAYMMDKAREQCAAALARSLLEQAVARSEFSDIHPADIQAASDLQYKKMRDRFLQTGTDLDALSPEEWERDLYAPKAAPYMAKYSPDNAKLASVPNKRAYYDLIRPESIQAIQYALVLCAVLRKADAEAYDPTVRLAAEAPLVAEFTEQVRKRFVEKG